MRAKGRQTLKARREAGKQAYTPRLIDVWADSEASRRGLRLPAAWRAPTASALSGWSKRLGLTDGAAFYGFRTWREYIWKNPTWSLRQLVGVMLEDAK